MHPIADALVVSILLVSLAFNLQTLATLEDWEWRKVKARVRVLVQTIRACIRK